MKRAVVLVLLLLFCGGCAKQVVVQVPDTSASVKAVVESQMTDAGKVEAIRLVTEATERMYREALARMEKQGGNLKELADRLIGIAAVALSAAAVVTR